MREIEIGGKIIKAELPKHKNPLPPFIQTKADNKVEPYKNVNVIIVPDNATNGDVIKAMFPNARVSEIFPMCYGDEVYYIPIEKVNGVTNEMRVMKSWWNAPYRGRK